MLKQSVERAPTPMQHLVRWGDILAIPGFTLLVWHFASIPERTLFETVLLLFSIGGLIADLAFTTHYLHTDTNARAALRRL